MKPDYVDLVNPVMGFCELSNFTEGTFLCKNLCSSKLQKGFLLTLDLGVLVLHNETCVLGHVK